MGLNKSGGLEKKLKNYEMGDVYYSPGLSKTSRLT